MTLERKLYSKMRVRWIFKTGWFRIAHLEGGGLIIVIGKSIQVFERLKKMEKTFAEKVNEAKIIFRGKYLTIMRWEGKLYIFLFGKHVNP